LRAGDQIVTIDGVDTLGKSRRDAIKLLRGPVGEPVELEIERDQQITSKTLRRAIIPVASVHGDFRDADGNWKYVLKDQPRIGYIRLIQFGEKSAEEISQALLEIGGQIDGLIIDLRNNSGGLLNVAVDICDMFLPNDQVIVRTRGRNKVLVDEYSSTANMVLSPNVPVCILVNRNSASASEIVAGCLQDHGRAILIGEQSWGKGTVQNVIPIQRGKSALKLTTASYWRPSGKHIDRNDDIAKATKKWGVQPNEGFAIELSEEAIFENVRQRNESDLQGLLTPEEAQVVSEMRAVDIDGEEGAITPQTESSKDDGENATTNDESLDPTDNAPHVDAPLQRAIEYLQSLKSRQRIAA
jgi:carboxyl-terminal processing protease